MGAAKMRKNFRRVYFIALSIALVIFTIFSLLLYYLERRVMPRGAEVLHSYAETNMFEILNSTINEIIEKYGINYTDLVDISYTETGTIAAINVDYVLANKIKSEVSMIISQKLSDQDEIPVYVPLGAFTNNMYMMGKGPRIKFILVQRGCVQADFEHSFESAGINQTMHTLKIVLDADVALMIPFYNTHTRMKTSAILAQTVINGECPYQYYRLQGGRN